MLFNPLDDGQRAERRRLDERPVDLVRFGVQRLAQEQPAQPHVDQDRPVPIVPVERHQAVLARLLTRGKLAEFLEPRVRARSVLVGHEVVHKPEKDVADRGLPGLDAIVAGQDRTVDDPAHARDVSQVTVVLHHHHVTRARAQDLDERAFPDARADAARVRVERADRDGNAGRQAELLRPFRRETARQPVRRNRLLVQTSAQIGQLRVERGQELPVRQAAPLLAVHRFVPGRAYAAHNPLRPPVTGKHRRHPVAALDKAVGRAKHVGRDVAAVQEFAPEPFRRVRTAALRKIPRPHIAGKFGNPGRLRVAGMVLPQPGHRVEVVPELGPHRKRRTVPVHRHRCAAGRIHTDSDDVTRIEFRVRVLRLANRPGHGRERVDIILRVLARDVRIFRIQ